jgi:hypothetical protein
MLTVAGRARSPQEYVCIECESSTSCGLWVKHRRIVPRVGDSYVSSASGKAKRYADVEIRYVCCSCGADRRYGLETHEVTND